MKKDIEYEKRTLLLEAAKQEFMAKGYNKASLRSICAKAGVTTGALYFFFEGKAELFSAIVNEPILGFKKILVEHFKEDREYAMRKGAFDDADMDHSDFSDMLVEYIYRHYDSFMLLITASENTVYENYVDEFVTMIEKSVPDMLAWMQGYVYDEYMGHWMSHITVDAFLQVVKHETDVEMAKKKLRKILNYLIRGWMELVLEKQ